MILSFILITTYHSQPCPPYTQLCSNCQSSPPYCTTSCPTPLLLSNQDLQGCQPCHYICQQCTSVTSTLCTKCRQGTYLVSSLNRCYYCPSHCRKCENQNSCSSCEDGYFEDSSSKLCRKCIFQKSLKCTQQLITQCQVGYKLEGNGAICQKCKEQNCIKCNDIKVCQDCQAGFYVFQKSCRKCQSQNCKQCPNTICSTCQSTHYLKNGSCIKCNTQCKMCSTTSQNCTLCYPPFVLNQNTCISSTKSHCLEINQNNCIKCQADYYLRENNCISSCSILCANCKGPGYGNCQSCKDNSESIINLLCIPKLQHQGYIQYYYPIRSTINSYQNVESKLFCEQDLLFGKEMSLRLDQIRGYEIVAEWKVYILEGSLRVKLNDQDWVVRQGKSGEQSCKHYDTGEYSFQRESNYRISKDSKTFNHSSIKYNSRLWFKGNVGIAEVLIKIKPCYDPKCIQCSLATCFLCQNQNLFKQQAQCVSSCQFGYLTYIQNYNNRTCLKRCPTTTYLQTKNSSCLDCQNNCLTCYSSIECITCQKNTFFYQRRCLLKCPDGFYGDRLTQYCSRCNTPCKTCQNTPDSCLSCTSLFLYNDKCVQTCVKGTYPSLQQLKCQLCNQQKGCKTCLKNEQDCTSCLPNLYLLNNACYKQCPQRFYNKTTQCLKCYGQCLTCTSETYCLTCLKNYYYNGKCIKSCPQYYYPNAFNLSCTPCSNPCLTCSSQKQCLSCQTSFFLFQNKCLEQCPEGFFKLGNRCQRCQPICLECINKADYCLKCKFGIQSDGNCLYLCKQGYYRDLKTLRCQKCNQSCLTCIQQNECTQCHSNRKLFNSTCLQQCPITHYSSFQICQKCQLPCITCKSLTQCLSCVQNLLYDSQLFLCTVSCRKGYYKDNQNCVKCQQGCQSCTQGNSCSVCTYYQSKPYFFYQNQCLQNCPNFYYPLISSLTCNPCQIPCRLCSSRVSCISCLNGLVQYNGTCISQCPIISYQKEGVCVECNAPCKLCNQFECLGCDDGYLVEGAECVKQCSNGYYEQLNNCLKCSFPCKSCINTSNTCLSCQSANLLQNRCIINCPSIYLPRNRKCQPCQQPCKQCQKQLSNCISCIDGNFLNSQTGKCGQCQKQSYPDKTTGRCFKCITPCKQCINDRKCLSCQVGNLYQNNCENNCPQRTYQAQSVCIKCPKQCGLCSSQSFCITCSDSQKFPANGNCFSTCQQGFYPDNNSKTCLQCKGNCKTCSNEVICKSCKIGLLFQGGCLPFCPLGYYQVQDQGCQRCDALCESCSISKDKCTSCNLNNKQKFLYISQCVEACPQGTYTSTQYSVCSSCPTPCKTCYNITYCQSCIFGYLLYKSYCIQQTCPQQRYNQEQVCVQQCSQGYLVDSVHKLCLKGCLFQFYQHQNKCVQKCPPKMHPNYELKCVQTLDSDLLLQFTGNFYVKDNILMVLLEFNQQVKLGQITDNSISITGTNASFVRILQTSQGFEFPTILQSQNPLIFKSPFNKSLISANCTITFINSSTYLHTANQQSLPLYKKFNILPIPLYNYYQTQKREIGTSIREVGISIVIVMLVFLLFQIIKNNVTQLYFIFYYLQQFYLVFLLKIHYPPNLGSFLKSFRLGHFDFLPSIFESAIPVSYRQDSSYKLGIEHVDGNYVRNLGSIWFIIIISVMIYFICYLVYCKCNKLQTKQHPPQSQAQKKQQTYLQLIIEAFLKVKRRYRWHYTADILYLITSYLTLFSITTLKYIQNHHVSIISMVLAILTLICYMVWFIFVLFKLRKHRKRIRSGIFQANILVFYRGIDPSGIGLYYMIGFMFRKYIQAIIIALTLDQPLFTLAVLIFTSFVNLLILAIYRPFILNLANYLRILSQALLLVIYLLVATIEFNKEEFTSNQKWAIGWIALVIGIIIILLLGVFFAAKLIDKDYFQSLKLEDRQKKMNKKPQSFYEHDIQFQNSQENSFQWSDQFNSERYQEGTINGQRHKGQFMQKIFIRNYSDSSKSGNEGEGVPRLLIKCLKSPQKKEQKQ